MEEPTKTVLILNRSIAIGVCVVVFIGVFFISNDTIYITETPTETKPIFINPFASTTVQAKGVFVYAPTSQHVMYQYNSHVPLPLASVTKIMTAYIASTILADDDIVTIDVNDLAPEGDTGFYPGEEWKFSDLRDVMLVASANDAAEAIRRTVDERLALRNSSTTVGMMNDKARELGLHTLTFESTTGLDENDARATAYGSAHDIALMFTYIIREKPEIFQSTREGSITRGAISGPTHVYKNTNVTINDMPSIIASKTGYTDTAGGNLIAAFDAGLGSPIVIAVLGSPDQESRFIDMKELAEKALRYINGTYYTEI